MLKHRVYFQAFQARWLLADSHALQQLGPSSPRICRARQGKAMGKRKTSKYGKQRPEATKKEANMSSGPTSTDLECQRQKPRKYLNGLPFSRLSHNPQSPYAISTIHMHNMHHMPLMNDMPTICCKKENSSQHQNTRICTFR